MESLHLLFSLVSIFILSLCFSETDEYNLSWKIENKILKYGEDLSIYCEVDNCCAESAGWLKWTSENDFKTLFIDVKDLDDSFSSKYAGGTNTRAFYLVIRNITRDDLNIAYSCTYGFVVSKNKFLRKIDVFSPNPEGDLRIDNKDSMTVHIGPILKLLAAVVLAVAIVISVYKTRKANTVHQSGLPSPYTIPGSEKNRKESTDIGYKKDKSSKLTNTLLDTKTFFTVEIDPSPQGYNSDESGQSFTTCRTKSAISFPQQSIKENDHSNGL